LSSPNGFDLARGEDNVGQNERPCASKHDLLMREHSHDGRFTMSEL